MRKLKLILMAITLISDSAIAAEDKTYFKSESWDATTTWPNPRGRKTYRASCARLPMRADRGHQFWLRRTPWITAP